MAEETKLTEAEEAKECAVAIFEGIPKKWAIEFVGEWNNLLLYLEKRVREEKVKTDEK